jgi:hypothetical protein
VEFLVGFVILLLALGVGALLLAPTSQVARVLRWPESAREVLPLRLRTPHTAGRLDLDSPEVQDGSRISALSFEEDFDRLRLAVQSSMAEVSSHLRAIGAAQEERGQRDMRLVERQIEALHDHFEQRLANLHEEIAASMQSSLGQRSQIANDPLVLRRADTTADLYRKLARLEASFVAVTNPLLLPGESSMAPHELPPEAMRWDAWKDVGDSAFAFAQAFNQERIFLDPEMSDQLSKLVTSIRERLTRSIYPNLQSKPNDAGLATLRTAIEQLSTEIPQARQRLERAFRESAHLS